MSSANIICLCHRILLLVCSIINNLTIFSPLVAKRCKKIPYCRLVYYSLVWADSLKSLICTAILAIPSALEDPTDPQMLPEKYKVQEVEQWLQFHCNPVVGAVPLLGDTTVGRNFTLEHGVEILPIPMNKMRTPGPRHTYKHMNQESIISTSVLMIRVSSCCVCYKIGKTHKREPHSLLQQIQIPSILLSVTHNIHTQSFIPHHIL